MDNGSNGNGRLPYIAFYMNDFFSDDKVVVMDRAQIGSYLCLLHAAWQQEPQGTLPDDDALLAKWARCDGLDWEAEKKIIMGPFRKVNDVWCQKRMMAEAVKAKQLSKQRSEGGKKRWQSSAQAKHKLSTSSPIARASDNGYIPNSLPLSEGESEREPAPVVFTPPRWGRANRYEELRLYILQNFPKLTENDAAWAWEHFEGNGWTNAGVPMTDWRKTIASWERKKICFPSLEKEKKR